MAERAEPEPLVRGLNLTAAASIVVGTVIGSGIFIGSNRVAQGVDSVALLFLVWIAAGLLTLLGALTFAEFGAAFPRSGGDYVFLERSMSPYWGFLAGWMAFAINLPASIAALALAFASQLEVLKPDLHATFLGEGVAIKFTAVAIIAIFTIINYLGVRRGGAAQKVLTGLKLALIAVVVVFGLSQLGGSSDRLVPFFGASKEVAAGGILLATVGAMWAYDGWSNVTRVSAEIKAPERNLPRALVFGILTAIGVYVLVNLAYLLVLGLDGIAGTSDNPDADRLVASRAAASFLGQAGENFIAVLIMVSVLGTINGLTLGGPRIYYAMARDGLFFRRLAAVHPEHRTPHLSILFQGILASILALFFSFEHLTKFVVLASWIAYALVGIGLIRLRRRQPNLARPYRVPFFPWVPIAFAVVSSAFVVWIVVDAFVNLERDFLNFVYLLVNIGIVLVSYPVYRLFRRANAPAT